MDRRPWVTAAAVAAALLLASCDVGGATPPSPSARPSSSDSSASSSPSASSTDLPIQEQMQRDKEAVKRAYAASFEEFNRLNMAGGATKATKAIKTNASGEYRRAIMSVLKADKRDGIRLASPGKLLGFSLGGWTKDRIEITACEDFSDTRWINDDGSVAREGEDARYVQEAVALKDSDGRWRIDGIDSTTVENFETASCKRGGA